MSGRSLGFGDSNVAKRRRKSVEKAPSNTGNPIPRPRMTNLTSAGMLRASNALFKFNNSKSTHPADQTSAL